MSYNFLAQYDGNLDWLQARTIVFSLTGSRAYGTATDASDYDFQGIALPPGAYFLGIQHRFEQAQWSGHLADRTAEATVFSLHKYAKLAADCNPNIIELLWNEDSWQWVTGPWRELVDIRNCFLSKRAKHTYSGYAMSQLKRIKTHRRWLMDPPSHPPTRAEFGLHKHAMIAKEHLEAAEAQIQKQLDRWEPDLDGLAPSRRQAIMTAIAEQSLYGDERYVAAGRTLGLNDNLIEVMASERRYREAKKNWQQYITWKKQRNPHRAELEAKHGYDTKHAMHLVRLMRMCGEIMRGLGVTVRRHDTQELLEIRGGAWSYDKLIEWAETTDARLNTLYNSPDCKLPKAPNMKMIEQVVHKLTERCLHDFPT